MSNDNVYVGDYRIVKVLSSGAFGRVYLAHHAILTNRVVALKILHSIHLDSEQEITRFLSEAQFLEKLKHPHILPIINVSIHEGFPYLVTEYEPKGSLRDLLQRQPARPLPTEEAISILSQIGQALQYAHQQNIIHRDLKPENILFNAEGKVILADFGLATVLNNAATKQTGTTGTLAYMAPEQFRGLIAKESDQYALGCIAYELFTGYMPFNATDTASIITSCLLEEPIPPRKRNPQLSEVIEQAILKALEKERADRHKDVFAFITSLNMRPPALDRVAWTFQLSAIMRIHPHDKEKTILFCNQAIQSDHNFGEAYYYRGVAHSELKHYKEALADFEVATQLDPDNSLGWFYKGDMLKELGRIEEAEDVYEKAMQLEERENQDEDFGDLEDNEETYNTSSIRKENSPAYSYNLEGNFHYQNQHYSEALISYEKALGSSGSDIDFVLAHYSKGMSLKKLSRYAEAVAAFDKAILLHPNFVDAYENKGTALLLSFRFDDALAAYEYCIHLKPNSISVHFSRGIAYFFLHQYKEALNAYDRVIAIDPKHAEAHRGRGDILNIMGRRDEALLAFDKAIYYDPNCATAWLSKGVTLYGFELLEEALIAFNQVIQIDPSNVQGHNHKANVLCQLGKYNESLVAFEYSIQLSPKSADAYNGKGNALTGLERYNQALLAYEMAISLEPFEAMFHNNRANTLQKLGRIKDAQNAYSRAKQLKEGING